VGHMAMQRRWKPRPKGEVVVALPQCQDTEEP